MEFQSLESLEQLDEIVVSKGNSIIFKHNTTCPISRNAKRKLQEDGDLLPDNTPVFLVDLIANREISNAVANKLNVKHESPQLLVIKDGKCTYNESLFNISVEETAQALSE